MKTNADAGYRIDQAQDDAYCPQGGLDGPQDLFAEKKKSMLADFTGRFTVLDIDYKMQLEQLAKEIDIMFKGASRAVYQGADAGDWYGTYLSPFLG